MMLRPAGTLILSAAVAITSLSISTHAFAAGTHAEPSLTTRVVAADVAGLYTISFSTQGSPMTLTLLIDKKDNGSYGGQMTGESLPPLPITSIKVSGSSVKIIFTAPDNTEGTINFVLASDNTITGEWMMTGDGSPITGKKTS